MHVVKNALIVTMDAERRVVRNGHIWIEGDRIAKIGPAQEVRLPTGPYQAIDATEMIAIPGFVSTHNHLYSAVVRSLPYGGPEEETDQFFISWIERFWFKYLEDKVNKEQLRAGTLVNCLDQIRSGITTTADTVEGSNALPGALDAVDAGMQEAGIRGLIGFETTGRLGEAVAQKGLEENIRFFEKARSRTSRVEGCFNVHTTFTCSTELIQAVAEEARRRGARLQMHCCDDYWHSFDTTRRFGKRALKYLEDIGFLGADVLLAHCSYINQFEDPKLLAHYDVKVAHNSESNAIFGFWPDMARLIEAGVTVGLGVDGMTHSMFEIMRTAQMIHRIRYYNISMFPDTQVLEMATLQGAKCLGKEKDIGSLEAGKKADLVLLDNRSAVPVFENNVYNHIVSSCDRSDVNSVFIDGRPILRNREFVDVDEQAAREQCRQAALELWKGNNWPVP
ncbi:MAG: amidohydrolase family protein [Chloroflexi bacterium]|nr:amidohydrolase family protein [Chloroflexota bacterium]